MAIASGTTLGPYRIEEPLGAGGMGEVYRATDTRLGRAVAIKVLPERFGDEPALLERFRREARVLAGLSHPHVCTLHDVGEADGIHFLVMELVDGRPLSESIGERPMPLPRVLEIGIQILDALDVAHRNEVVHRDVKPGNVMLGPNGVKLVDFGLARAGAEAEGDAGSDDAPETIPSTLTSRGAVLGTPAYMSPEQVKGRTADARSDLFGVGAVLYEMLTGRRPFRGDTQADLVAALLSSEPRPLAELRPGLPEALVHAVEQCLAKEPDDRWQSARDLLLELKWIASRSDGPSGERAASSRTARLAAWGGLAALLLAGALGYLAGRSQRAPAEREPVRLALHLPEGSERAFLRVSPDGRAVVYSASIDGRRRLWLRPLDATLPRPLEGTDGGRFPFWAPDSRRVGYFADGRLKVVDTKGGPPRTLCEAPGPFTMGSWGSGGTILFNVLEAPDREGIHRVPETGGTPVRLDLRDERGRSLTVAWPSFLPDGRRFLFLGVAEQDPSPDAASVRVGELGSEGTRPVLRVTDHGTRARYLPSGHLLYTREQALFAQAFDLGELRLEGEAVVLAQGIAAHGPAGLDNWSASEVGVLTYQSEGGLAQLQWKDRTGRTLSTIGEPAHYLDLSLAPGGERLAVTKLEPGTNESDIWIIDLGRDVPVRFTSGPAAETGLLWAPDATRLVYSAADMQPPFLHEKGLADDAARVLLPSRGTLQGPMSWAPGGLVYADRDPESGWDLWILKDSATGATEPLLLTAANELHAAVAPGGEWYAYASDESGRFEVYVRPYDRPGEKRRVSTEGGTLPRWRADGAELFYLSLDGSLTAVPVRAGESFEAGAPTVLFALDRDAAEVKPYDLSPDGERFVVASFVAGSHEPATVLLGWTRLLPSDDD